MSSYLRVFKSWVFVLLVALGIFIAWPTSLWAQSNSGTITGTIKDPSGAAIQNADLTIANPISGYQRETKTDSMGQFSFPNIPFNPYHLTVTASGFAALAQDVDVRSSVPVALDLALKIGTADSSVTVTETAPDLLEVSSTNHTDIDRGLFDKMPLESQSSSVSSMVTLASPGVSADSNGLFHGLGDHAENSFSVDGQPITDQQSKVFSNQIPADSIQSLEVIAGAPPAEYGDKTSLVIKVTTRSGLGVKQPTGEVTGAFGSFGTGNVGFNLALGGDTWGNFISANGLTTNRFLDPPETTLFHDNGNQTNIFDRADYKLSKQDTLSMNFNYTRSWFQTPNAFDNLNVGVVDRFGDLVGPTDQRSQIKTFNFAPSWTRVIGSTMVFELGAFARYDIYNYYPSDNPFADYVTGLSTSPTDAPVQIPIQSETISQRRTLLNTGLRSAISYVKGHHNFKAGISYMATPLTEDFNFGIVDPFFNPVCNNADGSVNTNPQITSQSQCGGPLNIGGSANPAFNPILGCYDLTRSSPTPLPVSDGCPTGQTVSTQFNFNQHATINEFSPYVQDTITLGNFSFNLGFRYDFYWGLSNASLPEPRAGIAYKISPTNTVLRFSYARIMETPFNENLILSSTGCANNVLFFLLPGCTPGVPGIINPGTRNEFHAGLEQAFGKYFVLSGDYIWKYTHNAYDFSVFGTTPITFPISWTNSKITGFTVRGSLPNFHGLSAFVVMSSVAARFFNPQTGGAGDVPSSPTTGAVFRIDHDEVFNQTTHAQYQPWKRGPWFGFNWRYDSGLVAGAVPFPDPSNPSAPVDLTGISADQQIQAGLFCGSQHPTLTAPLVSCAPSQYGSTLIRIPGTPADPVPENDDHNPPRIAPRNLFDIAVGQDDLFHRSERYKWSLRFTVINLTNKVALYNFLSTFSGTHYVTPRTFTGELGFHF